MKRSSLFPLPEYFDRYINLCDDVPIAEAIETSISELDANKMSIWKNMGDFSYEPGKWTIKDILQHLIDTERIFSYRALAIARGEQQQLPSFEEDNYALEADANRRSIESLVEELKQSHRSLQLLYASFTGEMLERKGMGFKGEYSVASIGFCMAGHQRWHFRILEERYYPLLKGKL